MSYQNLILLAPCHGLEDFPLYHTGDDAASMLACWTALWHPLLIHQAGKLPQIERCDYPPESLERSLLVLPKPCEAEMDAELPDRAASQGATLIRGLTRREAVLAQALGPDASRVDPELVADFLAFGFVYLQVELLTQQMRYASSLDQSRIETAVLAAAQAALETDFAASQSHLTSCFDALTDERSHYYPVDVFLLDLTLLAPGTSAGALERQLADSVPQNLMATGETLEALAERHPGLLETLRSALDGGALGLAGGEYSELPLPQMSLDTALRQLQQGAAAYTRCLGRGPTTYGRRRNGLFPGISQLLRHCRFSTALHMMWDEGRCPESSQCKTQWQVNDEVLDTIARTPLDASAHETFLNLPSQLSDSMDMDHVATRMFIHWPGHVVPWYQDLRRAARYGTALGRFVTLGEYFEETGDSGSREVFSSDDYRYPYLRQDVGRKEADPLSRWVRYWRRSGDLIMSRGSWLLRESLARGGDEPSRQQDWVTREREVDRHVIAPESEADADIDQQLAQTLAQEAAAIGSRLAADRSKRPAITVLNPFSFPRRVVVDTTALGSGPDQDTVYATNVEPDGKSWSVVDVPPMGFARLIAGRAAKRDMPGPLLEEGLTLRNEFLQAQIDPETGALRSLKDYRLRGTRLSQQLAFRITVPKTGQAWVDRQAPVAYTVMSADSVEVSRNGKIRAEITSRGRLLGLGGEPFGQFVQRYQLTRGSRVLAVQIELTPEASFQDDPWDSYYACRFAWSDAAAVLKRGMNLQAQDVGKPRFETPLFIDMDSGTHHTSILTGGLPYHRRIDDKQLDTLLLVDGESARHFRLGIGVDLPYVTRSALDFLAASAPTCSVDTSSDAGWLFHIDAKNVLATWWEPLDPSRFRVRLLETEGRDATVRLRGFRAFKHAYLVDTTGEATHELAVTEGIVELQLQAHQLRELCVHW